MLFRVNRDCEGLTLVEVLVALVIMGAIVGVIITSIMVMDTTVGKGRNRVYAISQVRNAQLWIQRDGKMAREIDINTGSPSGLPLTLRWVDWSGTKNEVSYYIEDNYLRRSHIEKTASDSEIASHITMIADSILTGSPHTVCQSGTGTYFSFTITASEGNGKYEGRAKRVFEVQPRPGS